MFYLVAAIVTCLLCRSWHLRALTLRQELLGAQRRGVFRLELRRKAELVVHPDGCGGVCLPTPRETRSLVLVLWRLQLWTRRQSVALPAALEDMIDQVQASDGDAYFPACFCSIGPLRPESLLHALA